MRKSQQEALKEAQRAYILPLSKSESTYRAAIYVDNGQGLEVLWPSDSDLRKKSKELLPSQIYSTIEKYPAFHFVIRGCGFNRVDEIRQELRKVNPELEVLVISGWSPSNN